MKKLVLGAATALSLAAGAASAQPVGPLVVGVDHPGAVTLEETQYVFGGHDFCWYDNAWRGPGFYYCGFAWRRGYGWGGPAGWRGWYGGGRYWRNGAWIGPRGYAHREWGGWRGEHDYHGGWRR
jgi:hypothetical protein